MGIVEDTLEILRTADTLSDRALRDLAQNLPSDYAITYTFAAEIGPDGAPLNAGAELARTWVYDSSGGRTGITVGAITAGTSDGLPFEGAVEIGIARIGESGVSSISGFAATVEGGFITGAGLTLPLRFFDYAETALEMFDSVTAGDIAAAAELLEIAPDGTVLFFSNGLQGGRGVEISLGVSDRTWSPEALVTAYTIEQAFQSGLSVPDALLELLARNPELLGNEEFQEMVRDEIAGKLGADAYLNFNTQATRVLVDLGHADLVPVPEEPLCFAAQTYIDMWPLDNDLKLGPDGIFDQNEVRSKIWTKPIESIKAGDIVVSFDERGNLVPGPVAQTFQNEAKILLNFHGTHVTPGHVYFRQDSKKSCKFETLIDVLRDDGVIQHQDGSLIRAATNVPVGDPRDGFVKAVTGPRNADGSVEVRDQGRIRLGTRFIVNGKRSFAVADLIEAMGGIVGEDGLIRFDDGASMPFHWESGDTLPKPEDYILECSGTTLEDIYKAAEWEDQRPQMPAPAVLDGGPVQPLSDAALSTMPRNEPLEIKPAAPAGERQTLNRKQRRALASKGRSLPRQLN
ncbi:hypothetical protein [Leisingera sp. ANG-Vp]|uniref:hypothetical protein n=1 Tax=Leisingera sp. ANG-Vp TaxID=1577896 RepID=UPI000AE24A44|nr:hypothetical protein [Leisingera sp. ANG-Vp]